MDPRNPRVLLAASNSLQEGLIRVYTSPDGGATWKVGRAPRPVPATGGAVDQWVAIGPDGREYIAYLAATRIGGPSDEPLAGLRLFLSSRASANGAWSIPSRPVAPPAGTLFDDKPMLTADMFPGSPHKGRLYLAWARMYPIGLGSVLSHSDDHGRSWSSPVLVGRAHHRGWGASVGVGRNGEVYVAWWRPPVVLVARSRDGGHSFAREVLVGRYGAPLDGCSGFGTRLRAQPTACVRGNPALAVDERTGRVFVAYAGWTPARTMGVFVTSFTPALRVLERKRLDRSPRAADAFNPALAIDPRNGRLWACFYRTGSGQGRSRATYSCATSRDGKGWAAPVAVASVSSDETVRRAFKGFIGREFGDYEDVAVAGASRSRSDARLRRLDTSSEEIYTTTIRPGSCVRPAACAPAAATNRVRRRPVAARARARTPRRAPRAQAAAPRRPSPRVRARARWS